jgi:protein-disulfide isomerase
MMTSFLVLSLLACGTANGTKTAKEDPVETKAGAATASPAADSQLPDPIATVNGEPISLAEFNKEASAAIIAAEVAVYEARKQALDRMVTDRLLKVAAAKEGLEIEAFLQKEIESKTPAPTDAEIEAFYNERRAQMPQPLEQMKAQLTDYLTNEKRKAAFMTFLEDLKKNAGVTTNLPPYRVTVDAGQSHRMGSEKAPIQIIEFSDFQCPYCTRGAEVVKQVVDTYGDKVSLVFRHFPLSFHKEAHLAGQGAECAGDQGKFWEYHDLLFANQQAMQPADLMSHAAQLKLDEQAFEGCLNGGSKAGKVDADMAAGELVGMNGTPGFYINGIPLTGAVPFENFKTVIDEELARLGQ